MEINALLSCRDVNVDAITAYTGFLRVSLMYNRCCSLMLKP